MTIVGKLVKPIHVLCSQYCTKVSFASINVRWLHKIVTEREVGGRVDGNFLYYFCNASGSPKYLQKQPFQKAQVYSDTICSLVWLEHRLFQHTKKALGPTSEKPEVALVLISGLNSPD